MGCHSLLQGIFPAQGWNPHLLCILLWGVGSLPLSHQGSNLKSVDVAVPMQTQLSGESLLSTVIRDTPDVWFNVTAFLGSWSSEESYSIENASAILRQLSAPYVSSAFEDSTTMDQKCFLKNSRKFQKAKLECHTLLPIYIVSPLYLQLISTMFSWYWYCKLPRDDLTLAAQKNMPAM